MAENALVLMMIAWILFQDITSGLHFPASLAVEGGHVIEYWPMEDGLGLLKTLAQSYTPFLPSTVS